MDNNDLKSPLMRTLMERGFVKDCNDIVGLDRHIERSLDPHDETPMIRAYVGFDLTAPSLHVGSMIPLMAARHIRQAAVDAGNHTMGAAVDAVTVLFGDATTRVGDPSDKNGARPILTDDAITSNLRGIRGCVDGVIGAATREAFNSEWLGGMSFMEFLTGPAREISLNRLVKTEVVARRLENELPMTLMELIYQAMQAMDFAHLARRKGVRLQIGGSDQWTNILAGVDLARRMDDAELFGLTLPLLTDAEGRKMGKTAGGTTVWLDPVMTSSFELWQFWRNVPDQKVREFLGLFTDLPMDQVRALAEGDVVEAKATLATEAVAIAHGREAALAAAETAKAASSRTFSFDAVALEGLPTVRCPVDPETTVITVAELVVHAGLAKSKADARRLAAGGGLRFNGVLVEHADVKVERRDFDDGQVVLSAGRKRHVRVLPTDLGPSLRPISVRIVERCDGGFDVLGSYAWDDTVEEDCIRSSLPDMDAARAAVARVRLVEKN